MQIENEKRVSINDHLYSNGKYHETERSISRKKENTDFTSVIINALGTIEMPYDKN